MAGTNPKVVNDTADRPALPRCHGRPGGRAGGRRFETGASIGIRIHPRDGHTSEALPCPADTATYRFKEAGKNGYPLYSG